MQTFTVAQNMVAYTQQIASTHINWKRTWQCHPRDSTVNDILELLLLSIDYFIALLILT